METAAEANPNGSTVTAPAKRSVIQQIADMAIQTFVYSQGSPKQTAGILELRDMLSHISVSDVGLSGTHKPKDRLPVAYAHITATEQFTMGMFFLDKGHQIPLHDHPGMVVVSRVLYGKAIFCTRDWVVTPGKKKEPGPPMGELLEGYQPRLRKVYVNKDACVDATHANNTSVLFPVKGNIHAVFALTDCCFLDILAPPYSKGEHDCHYYEEYTLEEVQPGGKTEYGKDGRPIRYLVETGPQDYYCAYTPYLGPMVVT